MTVDLRIFMLPVRLILTWLH